ncbi:AMP-binding protein [Sessilibacter corallicola]|uniref:AMP-binding protein n=1 Tax=Sessilibacter corallicola TaxID=2904075 RepID=UPI001E4E94E8|nr:AMP-binding protein [Sessilibacter corallicola]MCE2029192.1 AMP-binding protein [Sessilibacter corallicola]
MSNKTIIDVFVSSCNQFSDQPAFVCMGRTLTYSELLQYSQNFAAYLQKNTQLQPGDRIAIQLPNLLQYPVTIFGALMAGLVVVNTNPLYTPRELKHQLQDSGAKALVVLANIATAAEQVIKTTAVESVIITEVADLHPPLKRVVLNWAVKHIKKMVPDTNFENSTQFLSTLRLGQKSEFNPVSINSTDVAVLQYTGGTTGVSKGAMLTHDNLVANVDQIIEHLGEGIDSKGEIYVCPLPIYHIYAFTFHCLCLLTRGANNILIPNPRDLPSFVKALKNLKITGFVGLDTLFKVLCNNSDFLAMDFSRLKITSSGGMALSSTTAKRWQEVTGCQPNEGYGLTETSPVVSANIPGNIVPGSVGLPLPNTEVKTVDLNNDVTAANEPGELCIRGPQVMLGYWQRPDETAKVLDEDGWFRSGDIATIDESGFIRIVDRKKDMIVVSGFNVYPNEIDDIAVSHPNIQEAAAVGIPDERAGEAVKLFVVKTDSELTEEEVIQYLRGQLTGYKVPRVIEFCKELPKSNVGKVLRKELRNRNSENNNS